MTVMQAQLPGCDLDTALPVQAITDDIDHTGGRELITSEVFCRSGWAKYQDIGRRTHEGCTAR